MRRYRHPIMNTWSLGGGMKPIPEEPLNLESILSEAKGCDPTNGQDLVTYLGPLFFCFRNPSPSDMNCMRIMLIAMQSGIVKNRLEFVSTPPDIDDSLTQTGPARGRVVESAEHKGMKRWMRKHLLERGIRAARGEVSYLGYRVDVGSPTDKIFVECGDTEPLKVVQFLRHGESIGILQYYAEEVIWFSSDPEFKSFAEVEIYGRCDD